MPVPRIRLTLSLRVLLLLILVAALWLGWRVDKARRRRNAIAQVEKYNGYVDFDYQFVNGNEIPDAQPKAPTWLRRNLGDDYFRNVCRVYYSNQPLSDATLAPLKDLSAIEELSFSKSFYHGKAPVDPPPGLDRLTEAGLTRFDGLTRLRRLNIGYMELTGSMLRYLNHCTQLEELEITELENIEGGISDEDMPALGSMPRLRVLSLWNLQVTGSCLKRLRRSSSLEKLSLIGNPLSTAGFENIGGITSLKDLLIDQIEIGDRNLSSIRNLTGLTRLMLGNSRSKITDAGLIHLSGMTRLEWLDLTGSKITGRGLALLKEMKQLKRLCLGATRVDDLGLEVIAGFPKLETLELHQTKITDAGLVYLRRLKNLRELSVTSTAVTPRAVDELKRALATLTETR